MINAWCNNTKPKAIFIQSPGDLIKNHSLFKTYNHALSKEIEMFSLKFSEKSHLEAIFISGLKNKIDQLTCILDTSGKIESIGIIDKNTQVSLEIELDSDCFDQIENLVQSGVNRLCVVINSALVEKLAQENFKRNSFVFIKKAIELFNTLSLDIVLSSNSMNLLKLWLKKIVTFGISDITISFNKIPVCAHIRKTEFLDFFSWLTQLLNSHEFYQYELLKFARNLKTSQYMKIYSNHFPIKGFGVGAESFDGSVRTVNFTTVDSYCSAIMSESDPSECGESLTEKQLLMEKVIFGMQSIGGIPISMLNELLAPKEKEKLDKKILALENNGFIKTIFDHLQLTIMGLCFEDEVITYLVN